MTAIRRNGVVMFAMALAVGVALAQDETKPEATPPAKPTRTELRDKQLDVSLETRDIERVLTKVKRASDLAKARIAEAASMAESASTSLDKGDSKAARDEARKTVEMYQEIVRQLEALLAEETPQRVASARNLASQLARLQRQFARQFPGALNASGGGRGKVDPKSVNRGQGTGSGSQKSEQPNGSGKNSGDEDPKQEPRDGQGGAGKNNDKEGETSDDPKGSGDKSGKDDKPQDDQADGTSGTRDDKAMTDEERREALAGRAEQLKKMGETLKDVLQELAKSNEPADKEAVAQLEAILKETDLLKALDAMQDSAGMIRSDKLDDARLASLDLAERLEITAQRLDAAYRTIVAPQAEELRKLEAALADLREKLESLETEAQIAAWHREAQELLDQADKLGISDRVREDLLDQMKKAGLGVNGARNQFNWGFANNRYEVPAGYPRSLLNLQEEVQSRIQNLLLGDIADSSDEATPPKYQELVEQYYKVLSRSGKSQISNSKSQGNPKPETKQK